MSEHEQTPPIRIEVTEAQLNVDFDVWMVDNFGHPKDLDPEAADKWYERNGIMHAFIREFFSENAKSETPHT